jgi:hypothetical protein
MGKWRSSSHGGGRKPFPGTGCDLSPLFSPPRYYGPAICRKLRRFLASGCSTYCEGRLRSPQVENTTSHDISRASRRDVVRRAGWITGAKRTFCPGKPSYLMRRNMDLPTPRIISSARPRSAGTPECTRRPGKRSTVVIADSGTAVELLVFPPGEPVDRETCFRYRGTVWKITGKRDSGILVAEPCRH